MKCKNCGKEILNNSEFCPYCEKEIKKKDKSFQKMFIFSVIVVAVFTIIVVVFINSNRYPPYDDLLKSAQKCVEDEKYEEAVDYYNKCMDIKPEIEEPYEKLYEIYLKLGKEDLANEVAEKAKENLTDVSYNLFLKNKSLIDDKNELNKKAEEQVSIEISYEMNTYYSQTENIYFKAPLFNGYSLLAQNANKVFSSSYDKYKLGFENIEEEYASYYTDTEETYRNDYIISFRCSTNTLFAGSRPYTEYESFTFDIYTGQLLTVKDLVNPGEVSLNEYIYSLMSGSNVMQESEYDFKGDIESAINENKYFLDEDGFHIYTYAMSMQYQDISIPFINIKMNDKYFD